MRAHSRNEGRLRFSGLATQSEARSSSVSSARPLRRLALLARQPVPERMDQVVVRRAGNAARRGPGPVTANRPRRSPPGRSA